MADFVRVPETDWQNILDAIREKTGGTEKMLSGEVATAIAGIVSGGGGGGDSDALLASILDMTCAEFVSEATTQIKIARSFEQNKALTKVSLPNLHTIAGGYVFNGCSALREVYLPKLCVISSSTVFANCTALPEKLVFTQIAQMNGTSIFQNCSSLRKIVLPCKVRIPNTANAHVRGFGQNTFNGCSSLDTLVLGGEDAMWSLGNINTFANTPFAVGGTGGTVYVPQALISQYQQATNWSTLYTAGTCNFVAIEGSEYE